MRKIQSKSAPVKDPAAEGAKHTEVAAFKEVLEKIFAELQEIKENSVLSVKKMMTVDDLIKYTGYSRASIQQMMTRREIPFYKPEGRRAFFDRDEILEWMRRNKKEDVERITREQLLNDYINGLR